MFTVNYKTNYCILFVYTTKKVFVMNRKQKTVLLAGLLIIVASLIVWLIYGGEIFTKTQVLVEKKDELFGWTDRQWINKFVWGLDLSLLISGITIVISAALIFIFRSKKKSSELS